MTSPPARYPIPALDGCEVTEEIERSRFITTLARATTLEQAQAHVDDARARWPDATHHCWAWIVGAPGRGTTQEGCSDDGEPRGTAGKPMLDALRHSGLGDVVAVVVRYYGGVKLGKGGLVRAYGGAVRAALDAVERDVCVARETLEALIPYTHLRASKQLLDTMEAVIVEERFEMDVWMRVAVPIDRIEDCVAQWIELTHGEALLER